MTPTISLSEARTLIEALAPQHSLLLLGPPGIGKSELVRAVASAANLPCRSLLGTQLAPEDVSGLPRLVGERTVFCPPRAVLPEDGKPFCLFLDELPSASPDVQKAMYSLLLERRVGEHELPAASWVIAAGNRADDNAIARGMSSALVNRLFVLELSTRASEWLSWASQERLNATVRRFVRYVPEALMRTPSDDGAPFSSPRAWASLARALDDLDRCDISDAAIRTAVIRSRVSAEDAERFLGVGDLSDEPLDYLRAPGSMPEDPTQRWLILDALMALPSEDEEGEVRSSINAFCRALSLEERHTLVGRHGEKLAQLGVSPKFLAAPDSTRNLR